MWIVIYVVFMILLVAGVVAGCIIYSKMDKGNDITDKKLGQFNGKTKENFNNAYLEELEDGCDDEMEEDAEGEDSSGEYDKLFPYVMFDENDETDDDDKFLDDMIFMDLIDEDDEMDN